jgi:magnesium chelatase subunit H
MVGCMSSGEVMRLTRIGKFDMSAPQSGPMALLKKLRGGRKANDKGQKQFQRRRQMAMLRRIPKLLRFIPGTAQDVRAYFLLLQYWLAGSEQNISNMVRLLVDRYADGPREALARHAQGRSAARISRGRRVPSAHEVAHGRSHLQAAGAQGRHRPAPLACW